MADGRVFNSDNVSFISFLLEAQVAVLKGLIRKLWDNIILMWFSPDSFIYNIKWPKLNDDTKADHTVIELQRVGDATRRALQPSDLQRFQIFMVECRSREHDTEKGWSDALERLLGCLKTNVARTKELLAAVMIGTKIIVYEGENIGEENSALRPLHEGILDVAVPGDRAAFEAVLERVRAEGWDRA